MFKEEILPSRRINEQDYEAESEIDFVAIALYCAANKTQIARRFFLFATAFFGAFAIWWVSSPLKAQGRLSLSFKGIEKGEYPDGRKFNSREIRSPDVISKALAAVKSGAEGLAADIEVIPIIPSNISAKWAKEMKEGSHTEEYFPNTFTFSFILKGMSRESGRRFFEAIVNQYRQRAAEQWKSANYIEGSYKDGGYSDFLNDPSFDYQDISRFLSTRADILQVNAGRILLSNPDSLVQSGIKEIQDELALWYRTDFEGLEAMTLSQRITKSKETSMARLLYRRGDYEIRIRQKTDEIAEVSKLLASLQQPRPFLVAQSGGRENSLPIDSAGLERLISSNYISPLVVRITELQREKIELGAEKMRLEKNLELTSQARQSVAPEALPSGYLRVLKTTAHNLEKIVGQYNDLLDRYATDSIADCITIADGPTITRETRMPPLPLAIAGIFIASAFLSVASLELEKALKRANGRKDVFS